MDSSVNIDLSVFFKRWKIITIFAIIGLLVSYCYTVLLFKPTYWCSRAYIIDNSVSYSNDNASRTASINDMNVSRLLVETYSEAISTPEMIASLSDYLYQNHGIEISYRQLAGFIRVETKGTTEIMKLRVVTAEPQLSRIISDAIDVYLMPHVSESVGFAEITPLGQPLNGINGASTAKNCVVGLVGGAVLAIMLILVQYLFDYRVTDEEEFASRLEIPVLGNIPDALKIENRGYSYGNKAKK